MKIFLAGEHTYPEIIALGVTRGNNTLFLNKMPRNKILDLCLTKENMNIYLAGVAPWREQGLYDKAITMHRPYILESFYYANAYTEKLLPYYGDFLLDSGAFTFISNKSIQHNWDNYIERYADFIKKNKVKKYFELDIDSVVGYAKVLEYRAKLEKAVGWPCIPVWHKSRGIEEYKRHCQEYSYVGIGGYVIKELTPNDYNAFPAMIDYAHKNDCKVHCLGYTKLSNLTKHHFDSVDSTAWTTGNRFGYVYYFNGKTMKKRDAMQGTKLADPRKVALYNYTEWIKFQKWAETHL